MAKKFADKSQSPEVKKLAASVRASTEGLQVGLVPLEQLVPNPLQPRTVYTKEDLESLTDSIKVHGVLQPVIARPNQDGTFTLVAGHRRKLAAEMAGLTTVPSILTEIPEDNFLTIAMVENLQRRDLHVVETIRALKMLEAEYKTQEKTAAALGMKRPTYANQARLFNLGAEVLDICLTIPDLSFRQLERLLQMPEEKRVAAAQQLRQEPEKEETSASKTPAPAPKSNKFVVKGPNQSYSIVFKAKEEISLEGVRDALREALQQVEEKLNQQENQN